jgi:hypothetical protein
MRQLRRLAVLSVISSLLFTPTPALAESARPPTTSPASAVRVQPPAPESRSVAPGKRNELLGGGWRTSSDRAVTTTGDATGFHVLVADAKDGYRWRTVASLSEPGFDADAWIGNLCVTASGVRAVVVYAPRTFTNDPVLTERGAFTAVVDLVRGSVRKLPVQTSLAYFNPGCGATESAVLTQEGTGDRRATRLLELDTATGRTAAPIDVPGQLTSAVPTRIGIVGADSGGLVRVDRTGKRTLLAPAKGVPYRLTPDADGGVVYAQTDSDTAASVRRVSLTPRGPGKVATLATGRIADLSVRPSRGGQVYVTGQKARRALSTSPSVTLTDAPKNAGASLSGDVIVTSVLRSRSADPRVAAGNPADPQPVDITATSLVTKKTFTLSFTPTAGAGGGAEPSPALRTASASPTDPADGDQRYCSVPRNDPRNQAMQPKPRQVEWAIDQAVRGALTVQRPANWKNLGMPGYTPQGMFPRKTLDGGGYVPAQIMLGIAAQESNMWQAARFAVPGVTANPLIGNYFGIDYYNESGADDWTIRWDKADCGYGVMQITDGMRLAGKEKEGETALPYDQQRAIALDFTVNVARGLQMLQDKWNETRRAGLVINNGSSDRIENWFFAVWAYNSGFHANTGGPWGVGWLNNPINPRYPADRQPFLEMTYADAAEPQKWPYPEKVMGWAGHPIELIETPGNLVPGYRAAWWLTVGDRANVKPPSRVFCDATNDCYPDELFDPNEPGLEGEPAGPCAHRNSAGQYDLKCWYHRSATWIGDCQSYCGRETLRFDPGYPYQEDATSYAPNCGLTGLPGNALVVDNLSRSIPSVRPNCSMSFANAGTFRFSFVPDASGNYPGKIDVHQLGTGFAGQFWMSNTHDTPSRRAVGTWTLNQSVGPWARVFVHLPVVGARTQQARYEIDVDGNGTYSKVRYLPQQIGSNGWVSLGVHNFKGVPSIRLSNVTRDGMGTIRVAWDAIAVQPLPAKPRHIVAALGDSYTSGEGAGNYYAASDADHGTGAWNACRRSRNSYARKVVLPGDIVSLGALTDAHDANHDLGFVACSGADTANIDPSLTSFEDPWWWDNPDRDYEAGEGQFHEVSQIESGVLDKNTTLVTLSLGGNDEDAFTNAIGVCGIPVAECTWNANFLPIFKATMDRTAIKLNTVLRSIHAKAPNAKIVLLSYPLVLRESGCGGILPMFTAGETAALAELSRYLRDKQISLATSLRSQAIPVYTADPIGAFSGHVVCDDLPWINGVSWGPNGEGDFHDGDKPTTFCIPWPETCLSRESFHPDTSGTATYAQVLRQKLDQIAYN